MSELWTLDQMKSQAGKRILITGANSGVGYSAAVELARHGAVVVMACRDRGRGAASLVKLRADASGPDSAASRAELVELDLASLDSVKRVAEEELARGVRLDCLINNAGVMAPPKRLETKDGFEVQFGTNVLGHYALTCRLMPALVRASGATQSRVVTLSSIAHKRGKLNFDDLQAKQHYVPMDSYAQSKLGDLMFAFELERRVAAAGLPVESLAVHPGVAKTNLFKVGDGTGLAGVAQSIFQHSLGVIFNTELGGAIPTLFAATSEKAQGGAYYGSQSLQEMRGGDVGLAQVAPQAKDAEAQARLWQVCEALTGVSLPA